jgi:hypothetical protein
MLSGGAEELVMVSFHAQPQGTLMYIGDIAIMLRRTLRSGMLSVDTSSCRT